MEYTIHPVKMGGLVKAVTADGVKVHLHGRLGVLVVPESLIIGDAAPTPGCVTEFYFSYLEINEHPWDYDSTGIRNLEFAPCLLGGRLTEVNDTAVSARICDGLGSIRVPRRWVFTPVALEIGQTAEFYLSPLRIVGWRDIPVGSI